MKVVTVEEGGCFAFRFEAETLSDAAFLVRFALNSTREIRYQGANADRNGRIVGGIVVGKRAASTTEVRPRRP